ncbi:MAG: porin family protein [Deltaproteobacteria bacterium]|nr:porin family protein [Deltaproteobacteria bacterium]
MERRRLRMKRTGLLCVLMMVSVLIIATNARAADKAIKPYIEGELGYASIKMESGGFNTAGPHENTGDDRASRVVPALHVGAKFFNVVRGDIGFHYRGKSDFTTNSYQPPVPTFFYATEVKDVYSLMFSVFAEPFQFKGFTPYVGAGIGSTWMKVSSNDSVVIAGDSQTKFTWQVEAGIQYAFTDHLGVRAGYRYVDMGKFDVPLFDGFGAAGNLTGRLTAHELMAAFRYTF